MDSGNNLDQNKTKNMTTKTYSIFGAGAAGLYTAWRLLNGVPAGSKGKAMMLGKNDILELYDWGKYDF